MGCCHTTNASVSLNNHCERIKEAIDLGSTTRLKMLFDYYQKHDPKADPPYLDKPIVTINNVELNPLSYSLFTNKFQMFKYLYESGANIRQMELLLIKYNLKGMNLICYKGYKELLEYYLPIYLKDYTSLPQSVKSYTIDLKEKNPTPEFDLPIHSACRAGMLNIISYLYKYFKEKYCPREFDILAVDEYYGEDCPLIACRVGNFQLVKFFHEICGIKFGQINGNKENAIMICVAGYNKLPNFGFIDCVDYLINMVGVDVCYKHEELLCLAEGKEMISLLERELEKKGVNLKKSEIDQDKINVLRVGDTMESISGPVFNEEAIKLIQPDNPSLLSAISNIDQCIDDSKSDFMSHKFE